MYQSKRRYEAEAKGAHHCLVGKDDACPAHRRLKRTKASLLSLLTFTQQGYDVSAVPKGLTGPDGQIMSGPHCKLTMLHDQQLGLACGGHHVQ